jgi:hypothetical protein
VPGDLLFCDHRAASSLFHHSICNPRRLRVHVLPAQAGLALFGLSARYRSLRCSTSNPLHRGHPMATTDTAPEAASAATTDTPPARTPLAWVSLIGRLTADPKLPYTPNGTAVTSFRIVNHETDELRFHNIIAWVSRPFGRSRSLAGPLRPSRLGRGPVASSVLSSPLSSRARRSLPRRRQSTPSARTRSATSRRRRGSLYR